MTSRTTVAQPPIEVAIQQWLAAAALVRCLQTLDCFDYVEPRQVEVGFYKTIFRTMRAAAALLSG